MGHGAVDAVKTPELGKDGGVLGGAPLLAKIAAIAQMKDKSEQSSRFKSSPLRPDETQPVTPAASMVPLIVIGASTGGPQAIVDVLTRVPKDLPAAIVIVQHITVEFSEGLASWLSAMCQRPIRIAVNGDQPRTGEVLIAGSNDHLAMINGGSFRYTPDPVETPYRPSVDVLFGTVASHWKHPGVGVLLTGMGRDGAKGLLTLKQKGWHTIAQDEKTSVVYGMPAAAAEKGAASVILPINEIGESVTHNIRKLAVR